MWVRPYGGHSGSAVPFDKLRAGFCPWALLYDEGIALLAQFRHLHALSASCNDMFLFSCTVLSRIYLGANPFLKPPSESFCNRAVACAVHCAYIPPPPGSSGGGDLPPPTPAGAPIPARASTLNMSLTPGYFSSSPRQD